VPACATLAVATQAPLDLGTTVAVTLPERYLLLGAVLVYGVPLAALLVGAALAALLFASDLAAAAGAALGLALALLAAPALRSRLERVTLRELTVQPLATPSK
jgi:sigma-E factor negative regulatory protein RseC